jgi:agmatine deiminase
MTARRRANEAPGAQGFRMPAEWEPHAATWLAWPHKRSDWPGRFACIPWVVAEIVRKLVPGERVRLLVSGPRQAAEARAVLRRAHVDLRAVDLVRARTDRFWTRDSLPTVVRRDRDGARALVNWRFNAWAKYDDWRHDVRLGAAVERYLGLSRFEPRAGGRRVVLEGGAIDVNGRGTLLTTEECLLSPVQARNPHLRRRDVERVLGAWLGVRKVVWLAHGIAGDDTHGHVDDLARFVGPRSVVVAGTDDRSDANHEPLRDAFERLRRATDQDGRPLRVVRLPMPAPLHHGAQRLPASYANFYVANRVVLVPTFNDPADRRALEILARCFPGREVVGIHAGDLVLGLGTLHCMTQQEPA